MDGITFEQYLANKHNAEMQAAGYVEYASVEIKHFHRHCNCEGANPMCRQVTHREWRRANTTPLSKLAPAPATAKNKEVT